MTARPIWLVAASACFAGVTALVLIPDLHNDNPFWLAWLIVAPIATLAIFFLLPRTTVWPHTMSAVVVGLLVLWGAGGWAVYHRLTAGDPHVTTHVHRRCQANLREISTHLLQYAAQHQGRFPDRLDELLDPTVAGGNVDPSIFVAWKSGQTAATGATTQQVAADFAAGGHCSYIYLGKGIKLNALGRAATTTVVAYEPLSNHKDTVKGAHFLDAEGVVIFHPEREARRLIAELESGHNPPREEGR